MSLWPRQLWSVSARMKAQPRQVSSVCYFSTFERALVLDPALPSRLHMPAQQRVLSWFRASPRLE